MTPPREVLRDRVVVGHEIAVADDQRIDNGMTCPGEYEIAITDSDTHTQLARGESVVHEQG